MTQIPFRKFHLLSLLEKFDQSSLALDLVVNHYFRENRQLGSKDRKEIAEAVYGIIRWLGLIDYLAKDSITWENRVAIYDSDQLARAKNDRQIPTHIRVSFPKYLYQALVTGYGDEQAEQLCLISNSQAPTTIRVNPLKTTRDCLFQKWHCQYEVTKTKRSPYGITFKKRINLFGIQEFKEGLFEIQDEASQLVANLIESKPQDKVMDFCAGSGGKTLAFAPKMQNTGQIILHDVREKALKEAKKRLKRAGIQNAQFLHASSDSLKHWKKKMDWVLVDAPCSGTGTLRRNPDMKWRLDEKSISRLISLQRTIFEQALSYLKDDGRIVFATCSILPDENENQMNHFLKTYPLVLYKKPLKTLPQKNGMDGFFAATFKKV